MIFHGNKLLIVHYLPMKPEKGAAQISYLDKSIPSEAQLSEHNSIRR